MANFNSRDIDKALAKFGMLEFFPSDTGTRAEIGMLLARMCISVESLEWLTDQLITHVGRWRHKRIGHDEYSRRCINGECVSAVGDTSCYLDIDQLIVGGMRFDDLFN